MGWRKWRVSAQRLSQEEAEEEFVSYAHRHPVELRSLATILGYKLEYTEAGYRSLAQHIPVIELKSG